MSSLSNEEDLNPQKEDAYFEIKNIYKTFLNGKIIANNLINLSFQKGEIHSIIGENGSGKSTLMNILVGMYKPDSGEIFFKNKKIDMSNIKNSKKVKIGMVHQHFQLLEEYSVLENIILGQEKKYQKFNHINFKKARENFDKLNEKYNFNLDPNTIVRKLNIGQKQKVEIAKVLWEEKNILIFDEPTATLSIKEIDDLLSIIENLKKDNKTIIFVSHKLQEVKRISDKISVLNRGVLKETVINDQNLDTNKISKLMFSNVDTFVLDKSKQQIKEKEIFKVENLSYLTSKGFLAVDNVSFSIKEGEIFGLAGIEGNGQEEIINTIVGFKKKKSGSFLFDEEEITKKNLHAENFIAHIPIDRIKYGIAPQMSLIFNSMFNDINNSKFSKLRIFNKNIILSRKNIINHTQQIIEKLQVHGADDLENEIRNLSGGNQQKFVIGRELLKKHKLLIAGHPTRGLDIKAINNIYQNIIDNSNNKATLLYSLEISELINVCDRIAILYKGKIVDIIDPRKTTMEEISNLMVGNVSSKKQETNDNQDEFENESIENNLNGQNKEMSPFIRGNI